MEVDAVEMGNTPVAKDVDNDYCSKAKNMLQALKKLLESTYIDESKIRNAALLLKQMKDKIVHCDESVDRLFENDFIRDIQQSSTLSADIDNTIKHAELLLGKLTDDAVGLKFKGKMVEWFRFWESFEKEVHSKNSLSPQFKLSCLKCRLGSGPLQMIKEIGTTDSEYDAAVKLLQTKFGNKKLLIESHLNALIDLEPPIMTPVSLRQFSSAYEYHISALKVYGTNIEKAGFIVVAVLNKKLPSEIWNRINKGDRANYWTFTEFQNALNSQVELLDSEFARKLNSGMIQSCTDSAVKGNGASETLMNERSNSQASKCPLCSADHEIDACPIYKTPLQKKERATELEICFLCFSADHVHGKCGKTPCTFCNRKHHTLLCVFQDTFVCELCSGRHSITGCPIYKSADDKLERAMQLNLCLMCMRNDHITENCRKKVRPFCKFCGAKHCPIFCRKKRPLTRKQRMRIKKEIRMKGKTCELCSQNHTIQKCIYYPSNQEKRNRAKQLQLCLLCAKNDHPTDQCLKITLCNICRRGHKTIFCPSG